MWEVGRRGERNVEVGDFEVAGKQVVVGVAGHHPMPASAQRLGDAGA